MFNLFIQCCIHAFIFVAVTTHSNHTLEHLPYIKREYTSILYIFPFPSPKHLTMLSKRNEYIRTRIFQSFIMQLPVIYFFLACNLNLNYCRITQATACTTQPQLFQPLVRGVSENRLLSRGGDREQDDTVQTATWCHALGYPDVQPPHQRSQVV